MKYLLKRKGRGRTRERDRALEKRQSREEKGLNLCVEKWKAT